MFSTFFKYFQSSPLSGSKFDPSVSITSRQQEAKRRRGRRSENTNGAEKQMQKNISDRRARFKLGSEGKRDSATSRLRRTDAHVHNAYWISSPVIQYAARWKSLTGDNDLRDPELLWVSTWLIVWAPMRLISCSSTIQSHSDVRFSSSSWCGCSMANRHDPTNQEFTDIPPALWCVAPHGSWRMKWSSLVLQVFQLSPRGL